MKTKNEDDGRGIQTRGGWTSGGVLSEAWPQSPQGTSHVSPESAHKQQEQPHEQHLANKTKVHDAGRVGTREGRLALVHCTLAHKASRPVLDWCART